MADLHDEFPLVQVALGPGHITLLNGAALSVDEVFQGVEDLADEPRRGYAGWASVEK